MLATYRPSGRFDLRAVLALAAAAPLLVGAAWLYQRLVDWIPLIYLNVLLTVGFGALVGAVVMGIVRWGKVRSRGIGVVTAVALGALALAASFYWAWQIAVPQAYEELQHALGGDPEAQLVSREQFEELYTFREWLDARVENGWSVGRVGGSSGGLPLEGIVVWVVWAIEAGIVLFLAVKGAGTANAPYCETCDRWTEKKTLGPWAQVDEADLRRAAREEDAQTLRAPKPAAGSVHAGTYVLHVCPECREGGFVDVAVTHPETTSKGKVEMKTKVLVPGLVLTSAERDALAAYEYPALPAVPA